MQHDRFPVWTAEEFTEEFLPLIPLANTLHQLLFPLRNGMSFTGTDVAPLATHKLYANMIAAFDEHLN
jgi:hypothetical protein